MNIELHEITLKDICNGYLNQAEEGVVAFNGKLNLRPKFQREFIYNEAQRNAVIDSILKNYPLGTMYWSKTNENEYEMVDGQQRTISICQYINNEFPVKNKFFNDLTDEEKHELLEYKLKVYICEGSTADKLDWFQTINMAGEILNKQEIRNAIYAGPWLTDAKRHFSQNGCAAYQIANKYLYGKSIRQDFLQTALDWISKKEGITIEKYMAKHQNDTNCDDLWAYFVSVINWVESLFPKKYYRPIMKGQPWGEFYNECHENYYDPDELEAKVKELLLDNEVGNTKGIYHYIFSSRSVKDESFLNLRGFSKNMKLSQYEKQRGICKMCGKHFDYNEMECDHIIPWHDGGKTEPQNLQLLCFHCNIKKALAQN